MKIPYTILLPILSLAVLLQAGCGGGGSTAVPLGTPPVAPTLTALSGMVSKGPVSGATVNVYAIKSGIADRSATMGTGQTVDGGSFSINLGAYEGPILIEVSGGAFTDEASGAGVSLKIPLHAVVSEVKNNTTTTVAVTPMTELAFKKAKGSGPLTTESIDNANASVALTFSLTNIISVLPAPGGETDDQKKYAEACGAFSRLINNNKKDGESLEDALERLLGQMGGEEENGGDLSADSTSMISGATSSVNAGTDNANTTSTNPGTSIVAFPTSTMGVLRLATVGIPFAMSGIDVTIALPLGITVDYDRITGMTPPEVVTISGVADFGNNDVVVAQYKPAFFGTPALLHIVLLNPNGFGLGEFATVQFNVIPGGSFPMADFFIPVHVFIKGFTGLGLTGVAVVPLSVEGI